jgi:hypothetical protein
VKVLASRVLKFLGDFARLFAASWSRHKVIDTEKPAFSVRLDDVVSRRLDDVVVLINVKTNRIFELNETGGRLWELVSEGASLSTIHGRMRSEFDVTESDLTHAIKKLGDWLAAEGLIANGHGH